MTVLTDDVMSLAGTSLVKCIVSLASAARSKAGAQGLIILWQQIELFLFHSSSARCEWIAQ